MADHNRKKARKGARPEPDASVVSFNISASEASRLVGVPVGASLTPTLKVAANLASADRRRVLCTNVPASTPSPTATPSQPPQVLDSEQASLWEPRTYEPALEA